MFFPVLQSLGTLRLVRGVPSGDVREQAQLLRGLVAQKLQWLKARSKSIWASKVTEDLSYDGIFLSLADCFALLPSAICHV